MAMFHQPAMCTVEQYVMGIAVSSGLQEPIGQLLCCVMKHLSGNITELLEMTCV